MQKSAGNVLESIFWNSHDYLEKRKTLTTEIYAALLADLNKTILKKPPHMAKKIVLLHQDNAPAHISMKSIAKFNEWTFELFHNFPYSTDISLKDYVFPKFKRWFKRKRFA